MIVLVRTSFTIANGIRVLTFFSLCTTDLSSSLDLRINEFKTVRVTHLRISLETRALGLYDPNSRKMYKPRQTSRVQEIKRTAWFKLRKLLALFAFEADGKEWEEKIQRKWKKDKIKREKNS